MRKRRDFRCRDGVRRDPRVPLRGPDAAHTGSSCRAQSRPDHHRHAARRSVGAYGYGAAQTPAMDRLAQEGVKFPDAYATAPITLTSHASLLTGRYPAGHGARHNGMRMDLKTPTLAEALSQAGFATGRIRGRLPARSAIRPDQGIPDLRRPDATGRTGRAINERPGHASSSIDALAWLDDPSRRPVFSAGCISSSRTLLTAIQPTRVAGRPPHDTTTRSRKLTSRPDGSSTRSATDRAVDARHRRIGSRGSVRRARRDRPQYFRLRHDAAASR